MAKAYETHPYATEAENPGIEGRLHGMAQMGGTVTLAQMMTAVKSDAANGRDPFAMGTVEAGLFLDEDSFEKLYSYAKTLKPTYPKRRRKAK